MVNQTLFEWLSIDLGRLTVVGWLLILVTLGLMVGMPFLFFDVTDPNLKLDNERGKMKAIGIAAMVLGTGFFYGSRWLLERAGINVFRPVKDSD
jgi:hypothetical protein